MPDQPTDPKGARGPTEEEIEALLKQYGRKQEGEAFASPASAAPPASAPAAVGTPAQFPALVPEAGEKVEHHFEMLLDVPLKVRIELGRCRLSVQDVLELGRGSVVELDKLAGDPLDIYVNDRLLARGEVLVQHQSFCVRITDMVGPKEPEGGKKA